MEICHFFYFLVIMFSHNDYVCFMSFRCINMIYDLDIFIDMLLHDRFVKQF